MPVLLDERSEALSLAYNSTTVTVMERKADGSDDFSTYMIRPEYPCAVIITVYAVNLVEDWRRGTIRERLTTI
jgi:hypothetical protein